MTALMASVSFPLEMACFMADSDWDITVLGKAKSGTAVFLTVADAERDIPKKDISNSVRNLFIIVN
jgi:hypothetical protein